MRHINLNYLTFLVPWVSAHSWIDCISSTKPPHQVPITYSGYDFYKNCLGFPRGYPGRDNHDINRLCTILIEGHGWGRRSSVPVCGTKTQTLGNYSKEFPMTKVEAGTPLRLWYSMNGHRTPTTTVSLYSYGVPNRPIVKLSEITDTIKLADSFFSSFENCQDITVNNTMCYNDWTVPSTWQPGIYSLVWFWPWNFNEVGEEYTACFEVEVLPTKLDPNEFPTTSPSFTPIQIPTDYPLRPHQYLPPSPFPELFHSPHFSTLDVDVPPIFIPDFHSSHCKDCPDEFQVYHKPSPHPESTPPGFHPRFLIPTAEPPPHTMSESDPHPPPNLKSRLRSPTSPPPTTHHSHPSPYNPLPFFSPPGAYVAHRSPFDPPPFFPYHHQYLPDSLSSVAPHRDDWL